MALDPSSRTPSRHAALDYRPPLALRVIRTLLMTMLSVAVLSVAYTGYWFYVASAFRDGLPAWIERMAGTGATLAYRQLEISGYPFQFRLIFHEPLLDAPVLPALGGKPLRWRASRVVAMMSPWNFDRYTIDLNGDHRIDWPADRGVRTTGVSATEFLVTTELHKDGLPESARFELANLRIADGAASASSQWTLGRGRLTAKRLFPESESADEPTLAVGFRIDDARLPPADLPLGREIARLIGEARVVGILANPIVIEDLTRWRDAGGILEFTLSEARYGPLVVNASGTAALDDALQPMFAGTAKVEGLFAAIDALRDKDMIRSRDAAMAKVMLGVLSRPGEKGGAPSISLPVSIQGQKLFAGPVPLMDVPPIEWPQPRDTRPRFLR